MVCLAVTAVSKTNAFQRQIGSDPGRTGMTEIVRKTTRPTRTSLCRMVVLTAALEMFWTEEPLGGQLDVRMSSTYSRADRPMIFRRRTSLRARSPDASS